LEDFLWDVWTENGAGEHTRGLDTEDFLALLDEAGLKDEKHLTMKFGLFTLHSLCDQTGMRRGRRPGVDTVPTLRGGQPEPGSQRHPAPSTVSPRNYIDRKASELLVRTQEECALRGTGWKCVVGYATKSLK
jgi:hypothetical protein